MDARTQRRLRREREREVYSLAEEILNFIPKKLTENKDFVYLKNKLVKDIQNGNNQDWVGTKYFTLLSVIKHWGKKCTRYIEEFVEDFNGPCRNDYTIYCSNPVDDFHHEDIQKQIQKMNVFQKKLDELYTNKFSLSRKSGETEYDNLLNELEDIEPLGNLYEYQGESDNYVEILLIFCKKYRLK